MSRCLKMKRFGLPLLLSLLLTSVPAAALDPGTAQGSLEVNGETIELTYACALMHDNAEGLLDHPRELRILVSDREVTPEALYGVAYLPAEKMAKRGKLHGVLISIDPDDKKDVTATVLYPPPMPGQPLLTEMIGGGKHDAVRDLKITARRVVGKIDHQDRQEMEFMDIPKLVYRARFNAPLFREAPVTADLKGQAAVDSPQAKVLRAKVRALANGDFPALKRLSTESANRKSEAFIRKAGPHAVSLAKQAAADMAPSLQRIQRVVVRGDRAVLIFSDKQWMTFVKQDGRWKSDD